MSFDSFQTSGNSPGRHPDHGRIVFLPGSCTVASAVVHRLTTDIILEIQKNLLSARFEPGTLCARLRTGPTFAEAA
jgi:hypothetical protein